MLQRNNTGDVKTYLGLDAQVTELDISSGIAAEEGTQFSEFWTVYQFAGLAQGENPAAPHLQLSGAVDSTRRKACLDKCYIVDEKVNALGAGRCEDECQCNGQRWCSHFGECTGDTSACISDSSFGAFSDQTCKVGFTTTRTTTTPWTSTSTMTTKTSTFGGAAASGESGPPELSLLGSSCAEAVFLIVGPCAKSASSANLGCEGTSCAVIRAASFALAQGACFEAICEVNGQLAPIRRWESVCHEDSAAVLLAAARLAHCASTSTAGPGHLTTYIAASNPVFLQRTAVPDQDANQQLLIALLSSLLVIGCFCACCVTFACIAWKQQNGAGLLLTLKLLSHAMLQVAMKSAILQSSSRNSRMKPPKDCKLPGDDTSEDSATSTRPPASNPYDRQSSKEESRWHAWESGRWPRYPASPSPEPSESPRSSTGTGAPPTWAPPPYDTRGFQSAFSDKFWDPGTAPPLSKPRLGRSASAGHSFSTGPSFASATSSGPPRRMERAVSMTSERRSIVRNMVSFARDEPRSNEELVQYLKKLLSSTTAEQRKKLFKEFQLRWHPDKNVGDEVRATEMFRTLQQCKIWFLEG